MKGVPLFYRDGFTIEGTGYFAAHQESHQILYPRPRFCSFALIILFTIATLVGAIVGVLWNVPGVFVLSSVMLIGLIWSQIPKKRKEKKCEPEGTGTEILDGTMISLNAGELSMVVGEPEPALTREQKKWLRKFRALNSSAILARYKEEESRCSRISASSALSGELWRLVEKGSRELPSVST